MTGRTEPGRVGVQLERLAGVQGNELLAFVQQNVLVQDGFAAGIYREQVQRNSPA